MNGHWVPCAWEGRQKNRPQARKLWYTPPLLKARHFFLSFEEEPEKSRFTKSGLLAKLSARIATGFFSSEKEFLCFLSVQFNPSVQHAAIQRPGAAPSSAQVSLFRSPCSA
jgi:hypothetical protein